MRKRLEFVCKICSKHFSTSNYKNKNGKDRKFCSKKCFWKTVGERSKGTVLSDDQKKKISDSLKSFNIKNPRDKECREKYVKAVGESTRGKYNPKPRSILEFSKRTVSKILQRINAKCSRCGWNESSCDIHHIRGKKIENPDSHDNLCCLCPSCHRMAGRNKIPPEELIPISVQFGDRLFDFYYG